MSTGLTYETVSHSSAQTEQLAELLGRKLRGGETIELVSDLGGGKTTFVRGLARGVGSADKVSSPSFTLSNEYQVTGLSSHIERLVHFDFYRLSEPGIMKDELSEVVANPGTVTVVEWADIVEDVLPANKLTVRLRATGENDREIVYVYPKALQYLMAESET